MGPSKPVERTPSRGSSDSVGHGYPSGINAGASEGIDVVDQASDREEGDKSTIENVLTEYSGPSQDDQEEFRTVSKLAHGDTAFIGSEENDGTVKGNLQKDDITKTEDSERENPNSSSPPSRTNSLVSPAPKWGPPSFGTRVESVAFKISSSILSFGFLMIIVGGAIFKMIPRIIVRLWLYITFQNHKESRPFYEEEKNRSIARHKAEREWTQAQSKLQNPQIGSAARILENIEDSFESDSDFRPTEGGPDRLLGDIGYYARRAGLDCETFLVQTEDGFILELFHLYNPLKTSSSPESERDKHSPQLFNPDKEPTRTDFQSPREYPVLLIPGLLQSPGAYCCAGSTSSLAFFFARSGLDVWLGSNRCGFHPEHTTLSKSDPRMWAWNLRHMGVLDLPALAARVLEHTGFKTLALVAHSQGTAETLVALAKQQRPSFGKRISIACLLAPAAYAGIMLKRPIFKALRLVSPPMFRATFGVHDFIPFMQLMRRTLPPRLYGALGYRVFNFLFGWSDRRWERDLRDRFFVFAPTIVSAESMRWWLGRRGFAKEKCILQTKEECHQEELEDDNKKKKESEDPGQFAWYDERVPPMALWIAGSDGLVDGRKLLKRLTNGREPYVQVVHSKIIEDYEHLDVIWAVDVIDQVGKEVLGCIWKTIPEETRAMCKIPRGCNKEDIWVPKES